MSEALEHREENAIPLPRDRRDLELARWS